MTPNDPVLTAPLPIGFRGGSDAEPPRRRDGRHRVREGYDSPDGIADSDRRVPSRGTRRVLRLPQGAWAA